MKLYFLFYLLVLLPCLLEHLIIIDSTQQNSEMKFQNYTLNMFLVDLNFTHIMNDFYEVKIKSNDNLSGSFSLKSYALSFT